jgi:preprotein translocase subunit SecG
LIIIVLFQSGKGSDMGAAFGGGGSQTLFGSSGASTFLSKATTVAAIVFMVTSLSLAYFSSNKSGGSIMEDVKKPAQTEQTGEAAPGAPEKAGENTGAAAEEESETAQNNPAASSDVSDELKQTGSSESAKESGTGQPE